MTTRYPTHMMIFINSVTSLNLLKWQYITLKQTKVAKILLENLRAV